MARNFSASALRAFAAAASDELGLDVYPYSVFHVFFEQARNFFSAGLGFLRAGKRLG